MLIVIKFVTLFSGRSSSRIPEQFENQQKCPTVSTGKFKKKQLSKERHSDMQSERYKIPLVVSFGENII